jgi:4-hydroxy-4-methyl-2-oxoglutarate aldolase
MNRDLARGHSAATLYEASKTDCICHPSIQSAWPGARLVGPAFTVQGVGGDNLALHRATATAPAGSVLVVDVHAAAHGHWGEVLTAAAQHRGIVGLLIDGGIRDVAEIRALHFPVFSRNNTVRGTAKNHPGRFGDPVQIGGLVIGAGDLIVGDADGVIALPAGRVDQILDAADARVAAERDAMEAIRNGATTLDHYRLDATGLDLGPDSTSDRGWP